MAHQAPPTRRERLKMQQRGSHMDMFRRALTQLGVLAAHPVAFVVVALYGVCWFIFNRENFGWHAFAVLATWGMTLLIQRAEHRDTQAIHAKLDELIHAQARARNDLTHIDDEEPEDIERLRNRSSTPDGEKAGSLSPG